MTAQNQIDDLDRKILEMLKPDMQTNVSVFLFRLK